jgi:hypothetical protein
MAQQQGLFAGADPRLMEQAVMAERQKQAFSEAQLSPLDAPAYMTAQAGKGLGQGLTEIGGAMMGKDLRDPRLIKAEKMKEAVTTVRESGISMTGNPTGYYESLAEELYKRDLTDEAVAVLDKASSFGVELDFKKAKTAKLIAELSASKLPDYKVIKAGIDSIKDGVDPQEAARQFGVPSLADVKLDRKTWSEPFWHEAAGSGNPPILVQENTKTGQIEPVDKAARVSVTATGGSGGSAAGTPETMRVFDLRKKFDDITAPYNKGLQQSSKALALLNTQADNSVSSPAIKAALGEIFSAEGQRAVAEIAQWAPGELGNLAQRIAGGINNWFLGKYTKSQIEDAKALVEGYAALMSEARQSEEENFKGFATQQKFSDDEMGVVFRGPNANLAKAYSSRGKKVPPGYVAHKLSTGRTVYINLADRKDYIIPDDEGK